MNLRDKSATAWSNLGRRKVRTALTSVGVIVGIMTIVTLVSLVNGVQEQVNKQFEKIGLDRVTVRPRVEGGGGGFGGGGFNLFDVRERTQIISPADVARWRKWPLVKSITPEIDLPYGVITRLHWDDKVKPVRITGDAMSAMRRGPFSEAPDPLAGTLDLPETRGSIVLNKGVLKSFRVPESKAASVLGQSVQISLEAPRGEKQLYKFKIIGVSSEGGPSVQIPASDRVAMKSWWNNEPDALKSQGYDSVSLRSSDVSDAKVLIDRLRKEKYEVQSIDAIVNVANRIFAVIKAMLTLVSGVALLVACIGIVNTMIMSIYERTREIGTLKAMGASRGDIRQMFMMEAGLIGFIGGAAGLVLSWGLGRLLNSGAHWYAKHNDLPLPDNLFIITLPLAFEALFFAFLIGVFAGLYPANRAARLDPLAALRHE
ncbi:macrolide export ATP-binding/permease protein MacB [Abditibacteriota bacterium]|nr:macrolide export ATP-binding/permease protein MacB [Abditibacteriota bacterium]